MVSAERLAAQAASVEGVVDELAATVGGGSAASGVSMCQEPSTGMVKKRLNVKVAHMKKDGQSQNESTHAAAHFRSLILLTGKRLDGQTSVGHRLCVVQQRLPRTSIMPVFPVIYNRTRAGTACRS